MDEIPMRDLLELSPEARKEERMDPVCGQTKVTEPPPPPGVKVTDGLDVETHTANLRFDMILHFLLPRLVSTLERCKSGYATAVNTDLPDSVWGVSNEKSSLIVCSVFASWRQVLAFSVVGDGSTICHRPYPKYTTGRLPVW